MGEWGDWEEVRERELGFVCKINFFPVKNFISDKISPMDALEVRDQ